MMKFHRQLISKCQIDGEDFFVAFLENVNFKIQIRIHKEVGPFVNQPEYSLTANIFESGPMPTP